MASTALYRKYRSQSFEDVLGQEHVTETLQAAIKEDRVGHAYLFSGSRGTGKTSTARILAKALNCENGPTPQPCNKCVSCVGITDGASLDVIEIDAASHGGVDDVRELRENAVLAPAAARRKIYIIDEAHMVSTAGWNAFLKTVEEPPEHVIFVFATTEPHKVLPTILSRCQRFDFRRISSATIAEHLARVCKEEGLDADDAALQLIARASEGGMRDALSTLDQLASTGSVNVPDTARLLGATTGDALFEFADSLAASDTAGAVRMVARLVDEGQDLRVFARTVVDHLRALLFSKHIDDPGELIDATDETRARFAAQAERFSASKLVHTLKLFVDSLSEMRQQAPPRMSVELAVVRATMPEVDESATGAIARIERLERLLEVAGGASPPPSASLKDVSGDAPPAPQEPKEATRKPAKASAKKKVEQEPEPEPEPEPAPEAPPVVAEGLLDLDKIRRSWPMVLEEVRKASKRVHAMVAGSTPQTLDGGTMTITVGSAWLEKEIAQPKNAAILAKALTGVLGSAPRIAAKAAAKPAADADELDEARGSEPAGDPTDVLRAAFGEVEEG